MQFHTITEVHFWERITEFFVELLMLTLNQKRRTVFFLSGGSLLNLYPHIAGIINSLDFDPNILSFAQVDERFQPLDLETDINDEQIRKSGLWNVCEKKNISYVVVPQIGSLIDATVQYNDLVKKLAQEYPYTVALLGIGEDGHTAGLLPGYQSKWDQDVNVVGYENMGTYPNRITLSGTFIRHIDEAFVTAVGESKREILKTIINRSRSDVNTIPALLLHEIKKTDLYSDLSLAE